MPLSMPLSHDRSFKALFDFSLQVFGRNEVHRNYDLIHTVLTRLEQIVTKYPDTLDDCKRVLRSGEAAINIDEVKNALYSGNTHTVDFLSKQSVNAMKAEMKRLSLPSDSFMIE